MLTLVSGPSVAVSGTTASGTALVTGIADTAAIAGAVTVSGAGIPPGTLVKSIDSATQVTLSANATASGSPTLTFGIEAVSLAQAKKHLKIDADLTEDDDLIVPLITASREKCETETWRSFLRSTWDYALDEFPWGAYDWRNGRGDQIRIPNPPLVSVTSISYLDDIGGTATLSGSLYRAVAGTPGIIAPAYGTTWPYGRWQPGGVVVRYVAGYGMTADSVPAAVKAAIKLYLAALYYNRGDSEVPLPGAVLALLATVQHGAVS
jgi:uncharacterized phiE125 gp8 family phage protein